MKRGSLVVYTPPGTKLVSPYEDAERYVVIGLFEDDEDYVWIANASDTMHKVPEVTAELIGDLTEVDE